jgi:excisionase family DNA binding protein
MATQHELLLTDTEAAEYLGLKRGTLQVWRCTKRYPLAYLKIGRNIRYRQSDLDAFLQSRTVNGEAA